MFKFALIAAIVFALALQSTVAFPQAEETELFIDYELEDIGSGPPEDYEVTTETPTDASTQTPTDASTQTPTDASTQTPTDASTQTPTDATTKMPTDATTEMPTDATDDCQGVTCAMKGERGDPGPQGPPGADGEPGFCDASSCTFTGPEPPPAEKGQKGEKGDSGAPGPIGLPGIDGEDGVNGTDGEDGMKGLPGMQGLPGPEGPVGETGTPGSKGLPGMPGLPGPMGPQGNPGRKGVPGLKGEKGESGAVEIITRVDSQPCSEVFLGVIRFDPDTGHLFYCNGTEWVCIQTKDCPEEPPEAPTCPSPFGEQEIGDKWYQVFVRNVTQATQDAADIVIIVDESGSMVAEQRWLLNMVTSLETTLIENGVGDGDVRNRYCLVGFGSFGDLEPGHFRLANGQTCFLAGDFPLAQSQLITAGLFEDGYEAMKFALDNTPFRENPFIAKNFILVTDEGRTIIPEGIDLTREIIQNTLVENDILLNAVVLADYELDDNVNETVIGVDARGVSLVLQPDGEFSEVNESVSITAAEKETASDYVDLAVSVGGAAWALRVLREASNDNLTDLVESFTSALTQIKLREIRAIIESCRKCVCVAKDGPEGELIAEAECTIAQDSQFCRCIVENGGEGRDMTDCVPSLPGEDGGDQVTGGLVRRGNSISEIPRSPDFVLLDSETIP